MSDFRDPSIWGRRPQNEEHLEKIKKDREEYYRRSGIDPAMVDFSPPAKPFVPRSDLLDEFLWALAQMGVEDCIKTFTEVRHSVTELVEKRMIEGQDNISRENIQVNFCRDFLECAFNGSNCKPTPYPAR